MQAHSGINTDGDKSIIGVSSVILEGFRNYSELSLDLAPGFNVLAGQNAQGKTNFLEALYLVSTTRLLRGQRDAEAVQEGRLKASVIVHTCTSDTRLGMSLERGLRKRASLNGLNLPRAADIIGRLPTVCVSAADMAIVCGEPADRRMFLDLELSGLSPSYLRHLSLYKRALEQRNALLRSGREVMPQASEFEPWEAQMAHHGSSLRVARQEFVHRLAPATAIVHCTMGDGEELALRYVAKDEGDVEESLSAMLGASRLSDVARGGTSVGPHRDDLSLDIGGRDGRLYGSQGQQRTAVISVKLATMKIACEELGSPPLLLLDDILSDLDECRRKCLIDLVLAHADQAILTCTETSAAGDRILERAKVFNVRDGQVTAA